MKLLPRLYRRSEIAEIQSRFGDAEDLKLAAEAIERMKLRDGESINDWARRLGDDLAKFTD